jgi:hypothetical protein
VKLHTSIGVVLLFCQFSGASLHGARAEQRQIYICVSKDASPAIVKAAKSLNTADNCVPFRALIDSGTAQGKPELRQSEGLLQKKNYSSAALNNLVIVGLRSADGLLDKCLMHDVRLDAAKHELYLRGYGALKGDIGVIISKRNPFLYSWTFATNDFSTVTVMITGTTEAGVIRAAEAYRQGMINGLVTIGPVSRPETSILDMKPDDTPPPQLPAVVDTGNGRKAWMTGWTQPAAYEYRAYIDYGGNEPEHIWRVKYLEKGVNDDVSAKAWVNGTNRLAWGNAVNIIQFKSASAAQGALKHIAKSEKAPKLDIAGFETYKLTQPTDEAMPKSCGFIYLTVVGRTLLMSSLPQPATAEIFEQSGQTFMKR